MKRRSIELLAPAGTAEIAVEAVRHGADAVYIGPPSHGARHAVSNSIDDIRRVVEFAHLFDAKVYVTVNTLVFDSEIASVERMIGQFYTIGVDALIVQDMGILRMDIPPIPLHASTQCDIRTPEKARFLQEAGFSQLVLARELSLDEIRNICNSVSVPVEVFIHGALCVSYSGRCGAGYACAGRSGNRGECPQICRQPFTLRDADGRILAKNKYLLSLKDFRAENHLPDLIEAGVSSFKIEGRLKEAGYVKNVTAHYSRRLDEIIHNLNERCRQDSLALYSRSSYGKCHISFTPDIHKSFNRGFTDYRLSGATDKNGIASILTPKSLGEPISDIRNLKPGDGISFFDRMGEYSGVQVNGIKDGRVISNRPFLLPKGTQIYRTSSIEWKKEMDRETADRKLSLSVRMDEAGISFSDETGAFIRISHSIQAQPATSTTDYRKVFEKLGKTPFRLSEFENLVPRLFFPLSYLTSMRREGVEKLLQAKRIIYRYDYRHRENRDFPYPTSAIDYRDNVANRLAMQFYKDHGVTSIEPALEVSGRKNAKGRKVMSSRHCILRELGLCLRHGTKLRFPLSLESGNITLLPSFDCNTCEMHLHLK